MQVVSDPDLEVNLMVPDLWQQEAIQVLKDGGDAIVDAPTGSGKTFIFEQLVELGLIHNAVFTVPTRALANDKLLEWRARGWNVGITTGDVSENLDAPVVIATLETQKRRLVESAGPQLLVIDEYQMLGDRARGVNYELAIALAPEETQLLLLSGSVANPEAIQAWMTRLGRRATLVRHSERPVPLEEVFLDGIRQRIPANIHGTWPRAIAKALKADLGPILVFATRRRTAEDIARRISAALPNDEPLVLTPAQRKLAGDMLSRQLKNRVAFHHSGLSYQLRAGLIEPLAKNGQLRVVVATTGLGAGINFSLRSVIVTDREYRTGDRYDMIRPDELLQMFGRAGRRGLDKRGYILVEEGRPRLNESAPIRLKRSRQIDWPAFIRVMDGAALAGLSPSEAANQLAQRLFSDDPVDLGLKTFLKDAAGKTEVLKPNGHAKPVPKPRLNGSRHKTKEILNSQRQWERRRPLSRVRLKSALWYDGQKWMSALNCPHAFDRFELGNLCKLHDASSWRYGREMAVATYGDDDGLTLTRPALKALSLVGSMPGQKPKKLRREGWTIERLEQKLAQVIPEMTRGGEYYGVEDRNKFIAAQVDFAEAEVFAYVDSTGTALLNPPEREAHSGMTNEFAQLMSGTSPEITRDKLPADLWYQLGLIDERARPTRRGVIFSFFNQGEGLVIAAALEDPTYAIEDIIYALANIRAGHRFEAFESWSGRLGALARSAYGSATIPGYLHRGLSGDYGDGAAEILLLLDAEPGKLHTVVGDELQDGDIERARLEWRSLLNHISKAPDYNWERWRDLQSAARTLIGQTPVESPFANLPELTREQKRRYKREPRF